MSIPTTRVRIFYPADPAGVVPGGIDTFIRGLLAWAPEDLAFSLVGMSTDLQARPLGRWTPVRFGAGRPADFMPLVHVANAGGRGRVPLSLRYTAALRRQRGALTQGFDVFDFHRPEPSLLFTHDARPKNAFFHQDPGDVSQQKSDMLWRYMPQVYERMERRALSAFDQVWCVRESGVDTLRGRYPGAPDRVSFIPTWVDDAQFHPVDEGTRQALRTRLAQQHGIDEEAPWILSVGRLDSQKDPRLMFEAFRQLPRRLRARWVVVGDGVLRPLLERWIEAAGLGYCIHLIGLQGPAQVADWMRAADLYALSSAYEGMPMALLEALGSGLPVVTTPVGEVRRVVRDDVNGYIAVGHEPDLLADALEHGLAHAPRLRGAPAVAAIEDYRPRSVLAPAYERYRQLGHEHRRRGRTPSRQAVALAGAQAGLEVRHPVLGVQVDALSPGLAVARLMAWAEARESRYACLCNVHSVVEARRNQRHLQALQGADLVLPDGAPIAWTLRAKGRSGQSRVDGPGTMWRLCAQAEQAGVRIGLFGATPDTLQALQRRLQRAFPRLEIAYAFSPPFRALSTAEDAAVCRAIADAGVGLLFVGLGCPKQERWMADHRDRLPAVMLGVGAAFDFHAGTVARAPEWMGEAGLEWLHRLAGNPRRLAGRYLVTNSAFIARSAAEVTGALLGRRPQRLQADAAQMTMHHPHPAHALVCGQALQALVARIEHAVAPARGRVIQFVAGQSGAGTSTMAAAYAAVHAARAPGSVLLLSVVHAGTGQAGALSTLLQSETARAPAAGADGVCRLQVQGPVDGSGGEAGLLRDPQCWERLRGRYRLVVLDMPSAATSPAGLLLAGLSDGVVVVVEAERSRAPAVKELMRRLRAGQANVLGTVLNKRRQHLPARLFRWL